MAHGVHTVFRASMAADSRESDAVDLGRTFDMVWLEVPDMSLSCISSTCAFYIQASSDGSTFRHVYHPVAATSVASVGSNLFTLPNTFTSGFIPVPNAFRYLKVESTSTMSAAANFKVICADMGG